MQKEIVKARGRQGTKSLDLTIPVKISKKYDINSGDLFKIDIDKNKDEIKIIYSRIYKNK